jgi:TolB-like protein/DNA-binding winged helix-turn-helix (wHTH) protein
MLNFLRLGVEVSAAGFKFEEFELYPHRCELLRSGRPVKIENIPLNLLTLLVEKKGSLVSRQEIVERLWGADVFLDAESGINTAIRKIRLVLKDDPEKPRFVQTVIGRGYRFVAEIDEQTSSNTAEHPTPKIPVQTQEVPQPPPVPTPVWDGPSLSVPPQPRNEGAVDPTSAHRDKTWRNTFSKIPLVAAVSTTLILLTAFVLFVQRTRIFTKSAVQIHAIAVIPLVNLSGDASQDYYADGMTDEIITALAKNRNLRVVSHTSTMQYKGAKLPLPEIARELNVDGILEGSIERSSDHVHMTVQLIYARTDSHVWAESYNRRLSQDYALPEELAQAIAREVKTAISPMPPVRYIRPEAHDAYFQGRYLWFTTLESEKILPYFEKAIQLQPDYAAAWSGLADTYAVQGMTNHFPIEVSEKWHAAALKALELDASLPEAHNSLAAWYLFCAWDPVRAEAEESRGLQLDPNFAEGYHVLSYILEAENRYAEGEVAARREAELEPYRRPWQLGLYLMHERRFDEGINELRLQAVAHPGDPNISDPLCAAYWLKGMYKESEEELELTLESEHDIEGKIEAHKLWVSGGDTAVQHWRMKHFEVQNRKQHWKTESIAVDIAAVAAFTHNKEKTLQYLEIAYRNHDAFLIAIQNEPLFDFLHSESRYREIVKNIGLAPAY